MKKIYISLTIACLSLGSYAQQLPQFSQYMVNDFFINPAVTGTKDFTPILLTLRNQWTGFDGSPKTQTLSAHTSLKDNMGVGAIIVNDKTGPINRTALQLAYSYHFKINSSSIISLGLAGKVTQYVLNEDEITLDNTNDNALLGGKDLSFSPDAAFGAYYKAKNYFIGLAIPQLFQPRIKFNSGDLLKNKEVRHYLLRGGYTFKLNKDFKLQPSLLFKSTFTTPSTVDINAKLTYQDFLWGGISYRTSDALVILLGVQYEGFRFSYSYDATLSNIRKHSTGTHEISLGYNILQKGKRKTKSRFY